MRYWLSHSGTLVHLVYKIIGPVVLIYHYQNPELKGPMYPIGGAVEKVVDTFPAGTKMCVTCTSLYKKLGKEFFVIGL